MRIENNVSHGVDINRALTDEKYAAKNIDKLKGEDYSRVYAKYGGEKVRQWESIDGTKYQISDDKWDDSKADGKNKAKEQVGYDGHKSYGSVGSGVLAAGGAVATGISVANTGFMKVTGSAADTVIKDTTNETASSAGKAGRTSAYVAAGLAIATAAKYWATQPNKEQVKAAKELYNESGEGSQLLVEGQSSLYGAQDIMMSATEETTELTEEAEEFNEESAEEIEEQKTEFDFNKKQFDFIKAKAQSGQQLRSDEKQVAASLTPKMQESQANIADIQESTSEELDDKFGEIEEFQAEYDTGAETIAEVQGLTDYAAGFDTNTRNMCYVEAGSQTLNAVSGAIASAKLMAGGPWNWALGIAAGVAAASSGVAAGQQMVKAHEVNTEIDFREATQELGAETEDVYAEELESFELNMEFVDELELEIPEDMEISDEPIPDNGENNSNNVDPLAAGAAGLDVNAEKDGENKDAGNKEADDTAGSTRAAAGNKQKVNNDKQSNNDAKVADNNNQQQKDKEEPKVK